MTWNAIKLLVDEFNRKLAEDVRLNSISVVTYKVNEKIFCKVMDAGLLEGVYMFETFLQENLLLPTVDYIVFDEKYFEML